MSASVETRHSVQSETNVGSAEASFSSGTTDLGADRTAVFVVQRSKIEVINVVL